MKILNQATMLCVIVCLSITSNAQILSSTKPLLFSNVAASFKADTPELDKAFTARVGSTVQLNFGNTFTFSGTILSSVQRYNNLSSIIIKSTSLHNTLLSISKRINDDNTISFVGRILNENFGDGYELKKGADGNYAFQKIKTEDLIQDY